MLIYSYVTLRLISHPLFIHAYTLFSLSGFFSYHTCIQLFSHWRFHLTNMSIKNRGLSGKDGIPATPITNGHLIPLWSYQGGRPVVYTFFILVLCSCCAQRLRTLRALQGLHSTLPLLFFQITICKFFCGDLGSLILIQVKYLLWVRKPLIWVRA